MASGGENPSIRSWRPASFDENFTEDADESGPVSKSVNTGHCPVSASKSEKVGTRGLVSSKVSLFKGCCVIALVVQVPPSFKTVKGPKDFPRVMKVELLLSYHATNAAPRLRLGISLGSAQSQPSCDESLQTGFGKGNKAKGQ